MFWCCIYSPSFSRFSDFFENKLASLKYVTAQEQNVSFHSWKMFSLTSLVQSSWSIRLLILTDRMGLSLGWSCFSGHLLYVLEFVLTVFRLSQVATCELENGFLSWFYSQRWRQMAYLSLHSGMWGSASLFPYWQAYKNAKLVICCSQLLSRQGKIFLWLCEIHFLITLEEILSLKQSQELEPDWGKKKHIHCFYYTSDVVMNESWLLIREEYH